MKLNQPTSATRSSGVQAPASGSAAPSVPISVYRELAAELQVTRAMVDSLNAKNQQMVQENQKLRQEVQRVIHTVMMLQPWVEPIHGEFTPVAPAQTSAQASYRPTWEESSAAAAVAAKLRGANDLQPSEEWITEQSALPHQASQTKPARNMGGLWLTLTVIAIIISAFGAGFLIMRPFLPTGK